MLPADSTQYWTDTLINTGRIGGPMYASNQSIDAELWRLGLHTDASLVEALATGPSTDVVADIRAAEADGTQRPGKQHDDVAVAVMNFG